MIFDFDLMSAHDDLPALLPSQRETLKHLVSVVDAAPVVALAGIGGMGRTLVARSLLRERDGALIGTVDLVKAIRTYPPQKWEEAVFDTIIASLRSNPVTIFDSWTEFHGALNTIRPYYFRDTLQPLLCEEAVKSAGKLVFCGRALESWDSTDSLYSPHARLVTMKPLTTEDYRVYLERLLGEGRCAGIDFALLHRYAPMLNLRQLQYLARLLERDEAIDTDRAVAHLERQVLRTNLREHEVEALSFSSLPGSEHIAEALETHVVLPFENKALAAELGLKARRGVLLYGPPGTGKTSIGRALAHRIKGKFFLIDGTFITEPPSHFFDRVNAIVADAKANSPSILFIDDADVLFGIEHIAGLSRYLLSLLDGLESETAGQVCVMMTAMDASRIPDALLRSGRVELWLETHAPDAATRARILARWLPAELPGHEAVDHDRIAERTAGFTPADLRRLAGDAKLLYAADLVAGATPRGAEAYLVQAIDELVATRAIMAERLADPALAVAA